MHFVLFNKGLPVHVMSESPEKYDRMNGGMVKQPIDGIEYDEVQHRWDWKTMEEVRSLAKYLTAMTGRTFLPVDNSAAVSPRYEICEAPKIGDEVSMAFNGDSYPEGTIIHITKGWRVTTSTGKKFSRKRESGGWQEIGGGFWMTQGHHYTQNPSF